MCITCYLPTTENNLCLVEASKEFVNYTHGNVDYVNYGSIPRYHNNGRYLYTRRDIGVIIGRYFMFDLKVILYIAVVFQLINIPRKFGYYCGLSRIPKYENTLSKKIVFIFREFFRCRIVAALCV